MEENIKYYAGIGSRETPKPIITDMEEIAEFLASLGYICNSGGADGADSAFERGAFRAIEPKLRDTTQVCQIFLPKQGFNNKYSDEVNYFCINDPNAKKIAQKFHPNWDRLSGMAKLFHTRNVHQVLGYDLKTPVDFIVCYTEGGLLKGGTAQALRIAKYYEIPIFNLGKMTKNDVLYFIGLMKK